MERAKEKGTEQTKEAPKVPEGEREITLSEGYSLMETGNAMMLHYAGGAFLSAIPKGEVPEGFETREHFVEATKRKAKMTQIIMDHLESLTKQIIGVVHRTKITIPGEPEQVSIAQATSLMDSKSWAQKLYTSLENQREQTKKAGVEAQEEILKGFETAVKDWRKGESGGDPKVATALGELRKTYQNQYQIDVLDPAGVDAWKDRLKTVFVSHIVPVSRALQDSKENTKLQISELTYNLLKGLILPA